MGAIIDTLDALGRAHPVLFELWCWALGVPLFAAASTLFWRRWRARAACRPVGEILALLYGYAAFWLLGLFVPLFVFCTYLAPVILDRFPATRTLLQPLLEVLHWLAVASPLLPLGWTAAVITFFWRQSRRMPNPSGGEQTSGAAPGRAQGRRVR